MSERAAPDMTIADRVRRLVALTELANELAELRADVAALSDTFWCERTAP